MTVIELFAGAGGASLGLLRAGFTEVRAVEWDASACATRRAAGLRCDEGDVRDLSHYEGVTADAVWSSFPCQAWSTAGKRLGKDDPRNGWPWTVDVIDQVKPRWFMAENVPGLTHHRGACNGRCADDCARLYFEQTILRELRERFAWVDYRILDAARFGVPQNRERLIIVAGPRAIEWPKETHAPPEELRAGSLFGETRKPWRTVREALSLSLALIGQRTPETARGNNRWRSPDDPAPTVPAQADCLSARIEDPKHPHARPDKPAPVIRSGGAGHSSPPMWLRVAEAASGDGERVIGAGTRGRGMAEWEPRDVTDEPAGTIGAMQSSTAAHYVVTRAASRPELLDKPSPTVTAVGECKGSGDGGHPEKMQRASDALFLGAGIRRLTPAECAILQDFPPDHPWQGTKTSIYAQIGNAVPGTLAFVVGRAVRDADLTY